MAPCRVDHQEVRRSRRRLPPPPIQQRLHPRVVWIWGGTEEMMGEKLELLHEEAGCGVVCGLEGLLQASEKVNRTMRQNGGAFSSRIFVLDDRRDDQFSRMTVADKSLLQNLFLSLFCRYVNVQGPHDQARRRLPNYLSHVFIVSHACPRSVLSLAGMYPSENILEIDLSTCYSR